MENVEDRILTAAFELFVAQGFSLTTIEQIARKANVSKGLVYYYFNNKKKLLERIVSMIELPQDKLNFQELDKMSIENIFNYYLRLHYEYFYTIKTICQQPWIKIQRFYFETLSELPEFFSRVREKYQLLIDYVTKRITNEFNVDYNEAKMRSTMLFTIFEGIIFYFTFFPEEDIKNFIRYPKKFFLLWE